MAPPRRGEGAEVSPTFAIREDVSQCRSSARTAARGGSITLGGTVREENNATWLFEQLRDRTGDSPSGGSRPVGTGATAHDVDSSHSDHEGPPGDPGAGTRTGRGPARESGLHRRRRARPARRDCRRGAEKAGRSRATGSGAA